MNMVGSGGMLCEEFRVEGYEVNVLRKYGGELGIDDLGNFGWKWRG